MTNFARLLLAGLLLAAGNFGVARAQAPAMLFAPAAPKVAAARDLPSEVTPAVDRQVVRSRSVALQLPLLAMPDPAAPGAQRDRPAVVGQRLSFNLFDDTVVTAVATEVTRTDNGMVWLGTVEGEQIGQVLLVVSHGVASANITLGAQRFHLRALADGSYQAQQIDTRLFPSDHPPGARRDGALTRPQSRADALIPRALADSGAVIDVMVVYSPAARAAAGGTAAMRSLIDLGVAETNQTFQNSGIVPRIRLAYAGELSYTEARSDPLGKALDCITSRTDGCLDNVHTLRNTYAADLVSFWIEASDYCGIGWLNATEDQAFSAVARDCATGYYSFGHEMGHNMGAMHDITADPSTEPFAYGHGFVKTSVASPWRTVMAYDDACSAVGKSCTRLPYWSNPAVSYGGVAMGTSATADNHRVQNERALTVANFRSAVVACAYALSASSATAVAAGVAGTLSVTSSTGCAWTAASNATWLTITSGVSATGSASVGYTVAANTTNAARTGTLNVAGQTFTVTQKPAHGFVSTSASENLVGTTGVVNTAVFAGAYAQYAITTTAQGAIQVRDTVAGRDGTDTLTNVQRIQFSDQMLALDTSGANGAGGIFRLYVAAFNRVPDVAGLGYWISQSDNGTSASDMAAGFTFSAEFQSLYGVKITDQYATGSNVGNLVAGFYQNILHRAADPAGLAFYTGRITSREQTLGQILAQLADSPENRAQVASQLATGVLFVPWQP